MKILAKLGNHLRKIGKKGKAFLCTSLAIATTAAMTVCASAAESGETGSSISMKTMIQDAGVTLTNSLNDLVQTMIPVIMGVLGSGLVIFGILALIKLIKKVFGKVAS